MTVHDKNYFRLLTINSGSSSLKFSLYHIGRSENLEFSGSLERIGLRPGLFHIKDAEGRTLHEQHPLLPDHDSAIRILFEWMQNMAPGQGLDAVGHRVVHGGRQYSRPHLITPKLIEAMKEYIPLAPEHLPHEIKAIQALAKAYPDLKQVVCFDTAFHLTMPAIARMYALPRYLWRQGLERYGFHGLSYEYIMQELKSEAGPKAAEGRIVIAHLGNGASMVAVRQGKSVETTMGFTPAGGLVMGTRSGDLDPGVILYLLEEKRMKASAVNEMINHRSGLLAVSGISSSMKDLLDEESGKPHAAEAIDLFCYQAKKYLGALVCVLGGLDTLIFTGGIGENAPSIRQRTCLNMEFMGIHLDSRLNDANAPVISPKKSPVTVRVMKTSEELMIARHTYNLVRKKPVLSCK
jgi:acetate kinase